MFLNSFNDQNSCHVSSNNVRCLTINITHSRIDSIDDSNGKSVLLLLSQNSKSCWITLTILFIFISFNLILYHIDQLLHFHQREKKSIEIIDLTNDDEYEKFQNEQFQVRYGSRTFVHQMKPYDLYGHFREQTKRKTISI